MRVVFKYENKVPTASLAGTEASAMSRLHQRASDLAYRDHRDDEKTPPPIAPKPRHHPNEILSHPESRGKVHLDQCDERSM
ncbi:unnamed protein product [Colias eurytheme]|nr:unnamed protein product [Colias eurytheme]